MEDIELLLYVDELTTENGAGPDQEQLIEAIKSTETIDDKPRTFEQFMELFDGNFVGRLQELVDKGFLTRQFGSCRYRYNCTPTAKRRIDKEIG